jgi:hypothetical protein
MAEGRDFVSGADPLWPESFVVIAGECAIICAAGKIMR